MLWVLFLRARNPMPSESTCHWDWPWVGTSKQSLLNSISPKPQVGTSLHFNFSCTQFLPFIIIMPFRAQPPLLRQMIQAYKCLNLMPVQRKILESILHWNMHLLRLSCLMLLAECLQRDLTLLLLLHSKKIEINTLTRLQYTKPS